jgi:DNA-binding NarL/FixJ family response regulator
MKKIKSELPLAQVVMLSGQDKLSIAAECIKNGAFDYIVKGETAISRLEHILTNIDQMMDDIYFRKFNSDMLKLLVGVIILGTGFVLYAINAGLMKVTFHF